MKRTFDIVVALAALVCLMPLFLVVALLIKTESKGPVFFKQERVGRNFRPFWIYKFRTMRETQSAAEAAPITIGADPRITRVGWYLRKTKIDELPQLINILKGEMTFVGPRPEVPRYVALFHGDYAEILRVRPGLTDLASLKYRDEAAILGQLENPEGEYIGRLLPDKIRLAKEYIRRSSFGYDLRLMLATLLKLTTNRTTVS